MTHYLLTIEQADGEVNIGSGVSEKYVDTKINELNNKIDTKTTMDEVKDVLSDQYTSKITFDSTLSGYTTTNDLKENILTNYAKTIITDNINNTLTSSTSISPGHKHTLSDITDYAEQDLSAVITKNTEQDARLDNLESNALHTKALFDRIYPTGSIYISFTKQPPPIGQWELLEEGRFLRSVTTTSGGTGGSTTHTHTTGDHTLSVDEIPAHDHNQRSYLHIVQNDSLQTSVGWDPYEYGIWTGNDYRNKYTAATTNTGGGQAHNHGDTGESSNMPPYINVFIYKRIDDTSDTIEIPDVVTTVNDTVDLTGYVKYETLSDYANTDHTHTLSDITDYTAPDLSNYALADHTHLNYEVAGDINQITTFNISSAYIEHVKNTATEDDIVIIGLRTAEVEKEVISTVIENSNAITTIDDTTVLNDVIINGSLQNNGSQTITHLTGSSESLVVGTFCETDGTIYDKFKDNIKPTDCICNIKQATSLNKNIIGVTVSTDPIKFATHGDVLIKVVNDTYNVGDILVPGQGGYGKKPSSDEIMSCILNRIPTAKIISLDTGIDNEVACILL